MRFFGTEEPLSRRRQEHSILEPFHFLVRKKPAAHPAAAKNEREQSVFPDSTRLVRESRLEPGACRFAAGLASNHIRKRASDGVVSGCGGIRIGFRFVPTIPNSDIRSIRADILIL